MVPVLIRSGGGRFASVHTFQDNEQQQVVALVALMGVSCVASRTLDGKSYRFSASLFNLRRRGGLATCMPADMYCPLASEYGTYKNSLGREARDLHAHATTGQPRKRGGLATCGCHTLQDNSCVVATRCRTMLNRRGGLETCMPADMYLMYSRRESLHHLQDLRQEAHDLKGLTDRKLGGVRNLHASGHVLGVLEELQPRQEEHKS